MNVMKTNKLKFLSYQIIKTEENNCVSNSNEKMLNYNFDKTPGNADKHKNIIKNTEINLTTAKTCKNGNSNFLNEFDSMLNNIYKSPKVTKNVSTTNHINISAKVKRAKTKSFGTFKNNDSSHKIAVDIQNNILYQSENSVYEALMENSLDRGIKSSKLSNSLLELSLNRSRTYCNSKDKKFEDKNLKYENYIRNTSGVNFNTKILFTCIDENKKVCTTENNINNKNKKSIISTPLSSLKHAVKNSKVENRNKASTLLKKSNTNINNNTKVIINKPKIYTEANNFKPFASNRPISPIKKESIKKFITESESINNTPKKSNNYDDNSSSNSNCDEMCDVDEFVDVDVEFKKDLREINKNYNSQPKIKLEEIITNTKKPEKQLHLELETLKTNFRQKENNYKNMIKSLLRECKTNPNNNKINDNINNSSFDLSDSIIKEINEIMEDSVIENIPTNTNTTTITKSKTVNTRTANKIDFENSNEDSFMDELEDFIQYDLSKYNFDIPLKYQMSKTAKIKNEEIKSNGCIRLYDNSVVEILSNGNKNVTRLFPDGHSITFYENKDIKQTFPNGKIVFYYAKNKSYEMNMQSEGYTAYKFSNNQFEKHCFDGRKYIKFPDGSVKILRPNGEELNQFLDKSIKIQRKNKFGLVTKKPTKKY